MIFRLFDANALCCRAKGIWWIDSWKIVGLKPAMYGFADPYFALFILILWQVVIYLIIILTEDHILHSRIWISLIKSSAYGIPWLNIQHLELIHKVEFREKSSKTNLELDRGSACYIRYNPRRSANTTLTRRMMTFTRNNYKPLSKWLIWLRKILADSFEGWKITSSFVFLQPDKAIRKWETSWDCLLQ